MSDSTVISTFIAHSTRLYETEYFDGSVFHVPFPFCTAFFFFSYLNPVDEASVSHQVLHELVKGPKGLMCSIWGLGLCTFPRLNEDLDAAFAVHHG